MCGIEARNCVMTLPKTLSSFITNMVPQWTPISSIHLDWLLINSMDRPVSVSPTARIQMHAMHATTLDFHMSSLGEVWPLLYLEGHTLPIFLFTIDKQSGFQKGSMLLLVFFFLLNQSVEAFGPI